MGGRANPSIQETRGLKQIPPIATEAIEAAAERLAGNIDADKLIAILEGGMPEPLQP